MLIAMSLDRQALSVSKQAEERFVNLTLLICYIIAFKEQCL